MRHLIAIVGFFIIAVAVPATATDRVIERHWANELQNAPGEAVTLEAEPGQSTFALYLETSRAEVQGGVILLHDRGTHPDWPDVIAPLRRELPRYGWSTLSVQMPVMAEATPLEAYTPLFDEAPGRIRAAVAFLKARGIERIAIIGHGFGAASGAAFLADTSAPPEVLGFVGIGMATIKGSDPRLDVTNALERIALPVLDIFGERDLAEVLAGAPLRLQAAQRAGRAFDISGSRGQTAKVRQLVKRQTGNPGYRQVIEPGADHFFTGAAGLLVKHVRGWLKSYVEDRPARPINE